MLEDDKDDVDDKIDPRQLAPWRLVLRHQELQSPVMVMMFTPEVTITSLARAQVHQ